MGIILIYLSNKLYCQKKRIKQLEKWLYEYTTDFEKLNQLIELYSLVKFENLNIDQVKLWDEWVIRNICKKN